MMVYMDDIRQAPWGWVRTFTVEQTIKHLESRQVSHLSLDNDLGEGQTEGYKVLDWLEETVFNDPSFPIPITSVHSSNSTRVEHMRRALQSIERIRQQQVGGA